MECKRPGSVAYVLEELRGKGNTRAYAEIKYDGERMQIHVSEVGKITIYSKSGRDSTLDRKYTHDIIKKALGFGKEEDGKIKVQSCILEGELLVYDAVQNKIEPFGGIQGFSFGGVQETDKRYAMIKFFDILYLNQESLLRVSFCERRRILSNVIRIHPSRVSSVTRAKRELL
jgi:DNA ligase-4